MAMKTMIWTKQSDLFKALGHPSRVRILEFLGSGERCVCEIIDELGLEQSNVSQHLAVLRRENVIAAEKRGLKVMYRIKHPEVLEILERGQKVIRDELEDSYRLMKQLK
ncbi:HTH ArsR-type DNA-binding domain protein [Acididesulfobacillus acetoxydans]|uniref:HTH ArsR-type DNA-binding domain protein n=2 Tax=Acididesulfobacillus acetoxydans TaxID=1561005 RepID=A0A8S0W425_9FIRM|nr:HTH ArsR-type DNA-binding domain protein [Acididesulfobacillus acetoxydans]CEJ08754.1 helix_turn_helix, Arsenical Resistance Operon Repressor [Acididesulfobacillus acetoxydans]